MTVTERSDASLVTGAPELFGELFERYGGWLYDFSARRVGRQLAEDLVAETFLVAFSLRDRYDRSVINARPWLFGILTNLLRKHHRAEVRWLRALEKSGTDPLGGSGQHNFADRANERLDAKAATQALAGVLAAMPQDQRDLLLLHVWAGLDYPELASALGLAPGTVRSRLHRAKARLRGALPAHYAPSTSANEGNA
ncbi:RNA polymerase subunit sigma-70 [Micromonospora ureilytica]|uniref:RNA polymerase subunit sigma-70 n=1 Tax=Micromonospora ureilytica TaxID=709868 RepID=A0A3N9XUD2_9ACTN|nr:sigma-70 family RNA polymerase sigma factor [Micromonospora ureilytica]RQX16429.1 RNA polymerase subunit sigma-70 [Micromonospora ureilytica]